METNPNNKENEVTVKLLDKMDEILNSQETMRNVDVASELVKIVEKEYDI